MKHFSLSSPLLFHAPSTTLTSYLSPGNSSLLPFYLTVRSARAVIQCTSSETDSRTRLIAQNVPWTSTLDEVRESFDLYGMVADVEFKLSMHNKARNRGSAFVTMETEEEALNALNNLNSFEFDGRVIKAEFARSVKGNISLRRKRI